MHWKHCPEGDEDEHWVVIQGDPFPLKFKLISVIYSKIEYEYSEKFC